ncbi:ABC transporter substrate-binding protein [Parasedimentitalea huanghaiensis]|uniref:Peptide ABC transporter substrate-binding protein n=1 Tax=Parasedimentitalea huanghaiensis TaxID=2682100 RepID=A0A6L6WHY5_9RHOB|nr:ABC transporter substrate-binding protein [Zongyanglinia huanghaiensis]MVO16569.1 peptide ABC transporter substrate-binding protein [Zongyanglinia huanghaiensis]
MSRIDRRALFTSGAAAALLAATGTSLSAAPQPGGTLRLAVPREGGFLDVVARGALYHTLTEIAPDGVLRGELASKWRSNSDARVWTFDLRSGVRFHDGQSMTANDVAASLLAHDLPENAKIQHVTVLSDQKLKLELVISNPGFPYLLADPAFIIARAGHIDAPLSVACGTGCYQVEHFQDGRRFRATKFERNHKDGQAGWVDQIEVIVIPDASVRAEALRDGYVDISALPDPSGLIKRGDFRYLPSQQEMALATHSGIGVPKVIGKRVALDDGRIAERWWRV